jgi:hypothetical protein
VHHLRELNCFYVVQIKVKSWPLVDGSYARNEVKPYASSRSRGGYASSFSPGWYQDGWLFGGWQRQADDMPK